jgi:hypothetical protein
MTLKAKMIPSMLVDFLVSSQAAKAEGTAGQYKESGMFMVGGHQWKLRCYSTCINDHEWMDGCSRRHCRHPRSCAQIPNGTCIVAAMNTALTLGDTVALYYCCQGCDCFLPRRRGYCFMRWLGTQMMKMISFEFKLQSSLFHDSGSTRKRI